MMGENRLISENDARELEIGINPHFAEYEAHVAKVMKSYSFAKDSYSADSANGLMERCNGHLARYASEMTSSNAVILVHPYFLENNEGYAEFARNKFELGYGAYNGNLQRLFDAKKGGADFNLVIADSLNHYCLQSSQLVEEGVVDDVIFTTANGGQSLSDRSKEFEQKNVFFGGGFWGQCLSVFAINFLEYFYNFDEPPTRHEMYGNGPKVYYLRNLIMNHPQNAKSFFPEESVMMSGRMTGRAKSTNFFDFLDFVS
jgi:hypothetical protein